jgi:hypothetical protein
MLVSGRPDLFWAICFLVVVFGGVPRSLWMVKTWQGYVLDT